MQTSSVSWIMYLTALMKLEVRSHATETIYWKQNNTNPDELGPGIFANRAPLKSFVFIWVGFKKNYNYM